jgi:hypothetical protein
MPGSREGQGEAALSASYRCGRDIALRGRSSSALRSCASFIGLLPDRLRHLTAEPMGRL